MAIWLAQNMAPVMFVSLIVFLLFGYPVAFALAACGLFYFWIGVALTPSSGGTLHLAWPMLQLLPDRIASIMTSETLLAIPFFTLMGTVLERSGMAEDLLEAIGELFGEMRGGLAYAVILVGALLAATTGVVAASVISMGLISLPVMLRHGYDRRLAAGVIAASGTLAQIIPPSLVLIVMAEQLQVPIGALYQAAFVPGFALAGAYGLYVLAVTSIWPDVAPGMALPERTAEDGAHIMVWQTVWRCANAMAPALLLIFLVLGTILIGLATPSEAGALGAAGAIGLAAIQGGTGDRRQRFTLPLLVSALQATARLTAFALFILVGARIFSLTFYAVGGQHWVEQALLSLPGGRLGFIIAVNVMIFVLAFFLEFFELAFIIVPLLIAPSDALGIDRVWLGVVLAVNMQTSFLHPPFGYALFYLRSVAPTDAFRDPVTGNVTQGVSTPQIYYGAIPFVIIQCLMVAVIIAYLQLAG